MFDEDEKSSGFLTVQWGLRNHTTEKRKWSRVGAPYTLCVWRRKEMGKAGSNNNKIPDLIGHRSLSAAMVEGTFIGGGMDHRAKFPLPSSKEPEHVSIVVRIERSLSDDMTKLDGRCQWSHRLPEDICATVESNVRSKPIKKHLDAVLVSMEIAPRLSHMWYREAQRSCDVAPPAARSAYQWAAGIQWRD